MLKITELLLALSTAECVWATEGAWLSRKKQVKGQMITEHQESRLIRNTDGFYACLACLKHLETALPVTAKRQSEFSLLSSMANR